MSVSGRGDVERDNNNIGIYGGVWSNTELGSGRALIADGEVIDTKRMILTK